MMRILNFVPGPGIEPGWVAPPVFETGASTDSAIRANGGTKLSVFFVFYNSERALGRFNRIIDGETAIKMC